MASCYPSDPARCALNDAVFEMAQVEMGRRWWKKMVNPGENAAEGSSVDLELVNVHCFLWILGEPSKGKVAFFCPSRDTFIFKLDFCCLGEIELTRDDVPNV